MKYGLISTWKMSYDGISAAVNILKQNGRIENAILKAVTTVEDDSSFCSVGFGGLPNLNGEVELDAAYMDGDSLKFGAVISVNNIKNPIKVANFLSKFNRNNILSSKGAESFASLNGFEFKNMLTKESKKRWSEKKLEGINIEKLEAYGGHDTVCVIGIDNYGSMANGVSTSGLFMKQAGRVGDSPIIGSGFYCDSEVGGASATGVGEEIMKGCLSFQVVSFIKSGLSCQESCEKVLFEHIIKLKRRNSGSGSISLIAMDKNGDFGVATNKTLFPFVVARNDFEAKIMVASFINEELKIFEADDNFLKTYTGD